MAGKLAPSGEAELSALSKQLKGTLEAHGQLHAIRAQLRACVHAALAGTPPPPPRAAGSADGRLALGLVADFLRCHGLQHSLATLACELGDWDERAPNEELCDVLRLPAGRPLLIEMLRARKPEPLAHVSPPPLREPRGAFSPTSPSKDNAPPPSPPAAAAASSPPSSGCRNAAAASVKGAAEKRGVGPLKQAACAESEEEWVRVEMARRQAEAQAEAEAKAEAAARAETEARREAEARARAEAEAEAKAKAEAARRAREVAEVLAKAEAAKEEEDARLLESHRSIWSGSSALPKMPNERRGGGSGLDAFMMKETEKERQQQQLREAQVKVEQNESEAKEKEAREKEEREKEEREEAKEKEAKEKEAKEKEAREKAAKEKAEAEAAATQKAQGSDSDRSERDLLLELEAATDSDEGDTFGEKPKPAAPREGAATRVSAKAKVFVVEGESDVSEDELWGGGSAKHLTSRKPAAKKQDRAPAERPAPRIQWEQPEAAPPSPAAAAPPPPAAAPPPRAAAPPPPPAAAAPAKPPPPAADDSAEEVSDIEEDLVFEAVGSDSGSDDAW